MITGQVNANHEAHIALTIVGPTKRQVRVDALIDTGFDGALTLPLSQIMELELAFDHEGLVALADGSETPCDIYKGLVIWDRRRLSIPIDAAETAPLVGTALLRGYHLAIPFLPGENIVLRKLPRG